jgi:subtilase family serine protease
MLRRRRFLVAAFMGVVTAALLSAAIFVGTVGAAPRATSAATPDFSRSCEVASPGFAACQAIRNNHARGVAAAPAASTPGGLNPADLRSAYKIPSTTTTRTVAIVDAFNDPNAESDLAVYRSQFGLPACTTANGCFKKVNQTGGSTFPSSNTGWAEEISLDIDMVGALCSTCHILLVEASSSSFANLLAADDYAAAHASYISNSWSGGEFSGETSDDTHFNKTGKVFTFASGDSGHAAGAQYPATSPFVVAVGGTHLARSTNTRGWTESAWSSAGSGCSSFETRPTWQNISNITSVCARRAEADISAIGDPATGVSVYDTFNETGWLVFGGTSVATPIIATVYAVAGNATTVGGNASFLYSHTASFFDVTTGSNGTCTGTMCHAAVGWDGPTGLGTPNGTGGF